jgi:hypothetical protein
VTGGGARAICLWALAALFSPLFFFLPSKEIEEEKRQEQK